MSIGPLTVFHFIYIVSNRLTCSIFVYLFPCNAAVSTIRLVNYSPSAIILIDRWDMEELRQFLMWVMLAMTVLLVVIILGASGQWPTSLYMYTCCCYKKPFFFSMSETWKISSIQFHLQKSYCTLKLLDFFQDVTWHLTLDFALICP